ncbi:uncharacterized protein LOC111346373 [Stylophora pistillata]|uniref:G-protein coupled receptor GRL101 n=1 Tax=Stylophora pistillata TaxID=50429 RepID=A0A2B4SWT1_STYPI|nr:uncharacterized protein LOC111346373 [Stylophora pistillata]XP_022809404.1 uncharacterized protein LOC111346373 [Stylophora pistillata]XP_022809409.1 uncharacterized protein LOC111346373 [Stylophora pistillata]XP_022809416.1 uncharacterized protein LOC111346373 [Stylophora pistillata]XP_022809420.1 uncharacterized protein LOC111346373 [Stylophora pistillata]PFX32875.1 G-protein coupled receptor GRL101 [Stylophora pistillata]
MNTALVIFAVLLCSSCCLAFDCPKQCSCGETIRCKVKDLRILKKILPTNITRLDLSSDDITKIPAGTFENFTSLRYLSLANNSIRHLSRHSFRGLRNLRELNLKDNGELILDKDVFESLPSLRIIGVDSNNIQNLSEELRNRSHSVNVTIDIKQEKVHCEIYKKPTEECMANGYPVCNDAMDIREDVMKLSPFPKHSCVLARCENKQKKVICVASKTNNTCWPGMIGDNTGVKLALWTFGLLAVASNLLVLVTLLCNSEVRRAPLCIFVMNLLLGNILIGAHIVIVTVSDTVTYENSSECHKERWEAKLCVPLFIVKYIGLMIVVLSLLLVTVERFLVVIMKSTHYIDTCRALGYVFESWIFATIATVVLWTKAGNWGYLCSTFASGKSFTDINRGINLTLVSICVVMIFIHIFVICRATRKDPVVAATTDYKNTVRTFLLVLSTFFAWAVPYTLILFTVPAIVTETVAMQTMAISLSLNACLHTFLYSFDNDHLENLYRALSCRKEQKEDQLETDKSKDRKHDTEMGPLPTKKSLESLSMVEVKSPIDKESCVKVVPVPEIRQGLDQQRRGSELSKAEGAVIITNKSPTNSRHEEAVVLLHSAPSSPCTLTRGGRVQDEGVSECGTISSDTNVTWLSSECPSMSPSSPNALLKINDGNSTLSSGISSITPSKCPSNAGSLQHPKRKSNSVEKDAKRYRLSKGCAGSSLDRCDNDEAKGELTRDENQNTKRNRRMSPVRDIIVRVLSPKLKKRPKTLECVPTHDDSKTELPPPHKRTKSLVEGKDAEDLNVSDGKRSPLRPLSPVCLRDKKPKERSKEKRNGVLVFRAGSDGLEIHEDVTSPTSSRSAICGEKITEDGPTSPKSANKAMDWERLATFLVIKPVAPKSKIKISDKDKKKARQSLVETASKPAERIRIYENPAISLQSEPGSPPDEPRCTSPQSPTRRLAKLEESDKLTDLPTGLKQKNRVSTASTVSRVSKSSLEWDPSCAYEYGDEDVMPPPPPPPPQPIPDLPPTPQPSPGPERKADSADHVECVQVRLDPAHRYSLEWDPTGVQMRLSVISQDSNAEGKKSTSSRQTTEPEYV